LQMINFLRYDEKLHNSSKLAGTRYGSKKPFCTHETIFRNSEFYVFPTQQTAQIDWKFERKLKRIDPINDQIKKIISIKSSLFDR
jgi:hypothetical protein